MSSCPSGTEATETALKLIKTYGKTLDKKTGIILLVGTGMEELLVLVKCYQKKINKASG